MRVPGLTGSLGAGFGSQDSLAIVFPLKQILCVTPKVVASLGNHWNRTEGRPVRLGWGPRSGIKVSWANYKIQLYPLALRHLEARRLHPELPGPTVYPNCRM